MFLYLNNITKMAHEVIKEHLKEGMTVIDGTVGNGNDTLFMAKAVGSHGKVYGFDIQKQAIENTSNLLQKEEAFSQVHLIQDGHQFIDKYVPDEVDGAMYNLGYLPGGDHNIVTQPSTTVVSLEQCMNKLKRNGVVTVAVYYGHEGGVEEKNEVEDFFKKLDSRVYSVIQLELFNKKNNPPKLFIVRKL